MCAKSSGTTSHGASSAYWQRHSGPICLLNAMSCPQAAMASDKDYHKQFGGPTKKVLILSCRPDTSGAVPGAFVILLAQGAESAWTFAVRQVPLWLGRLVQVSGTSCKLHYFTQCRSDLKHLCVVAPVTFALSRSLFKKS